MVGGKWGRPVVVLHSRLEPCRWHQMSACLCRAKASVGSREVWLEENVLLSEDSENSNPTAQKVLPRQL
jgi:hypothetical protein